MPSLAERSWAPGPLDPKLAQGAVHVWRADLAAVGEDLVDVLSPDERERAERLLSAQGRERWMRAHGVLRALLGRYLEADPGALRFATGAYGRPELLDDPARSTTTATCDSAGSSPLSFNLSHSGPLAVYAFTGSGSVGVDVEVAGRPIDEVAIAARAFGAAEARRLGALEPPIREREFLRAWVRHEAELKWRGTGIGGEAATATEHRPWIACLDMGPRATVAVAVGRAPAEMRCWEWRT